MGRYADGDAEGALGADGKCFDWMLDLYEGFVSDDTACARRQREMGKPLFEEQYAPLVIACPVRRGGHVSEAEKTHEGA